MARLSLADLDWLDVRAIVRHSPPTSALRRSMDPDAWVTPELQILREVEFNTHVSWWHNTKDGRDGVNPPKPILLTQAERRAAEPDRLAPLPVDDMLAWLGWVKPSPN